MTINGARIVTGPGQLRARCLEPGEDVNTVDPEDDTFPVQVGASLSMATPCGLVVFRQDGGLWARSTLELVERGTAEVIVDLPPEPIGGMGIAFEPGPNGVRVLQVYPGTAADGVMHAGDLIHSIDGHSLAGVGKGHVWERGTGPVGSEITVAVLGKDGLRRVVLVRAPVPAVRSR
jgi:hypothetical protein